MSPEYAWVVEHAGVLAGYVLGVADSAAFERDCERVWWPELRLRYPSGTFPTGSADARLVQLIHSPHSAPPELVRDYPAHLHIDLLPSVQGLGYGGALIGTLRDALVANGVPGIHLGVSASNTNAVAFYGHLGFTVLDSTDDAHTMGRRL